MPCLVCGYPRSDPAHLRTGSRKYGKRQCGLGEKPDDKWTLPLCRKDHTDQHHRGDELAWWASKGIPDPFAVATALYATRPPELRPLPAPAPRARKVRPRKPPAERKKIPQRPTEWPKHKLQSRQFQKAKP
jgi:hypothetical protein